MGVGVSIVECQREQRLRLRKILTNNKTFAHMRRSIRVKNVSSKKNTSPTGGHVFSPIRTIVELVQDINKTNPNRENCHYIHIKKNAPPTGGHVFSPIWTIFELVRDINKTNVLTNFHDDLTKIVTSIVLTRFLYSQIGKTKNAPPTGGHVFSPICTIFELVRYIN
ncbi:hypothetical protein DPMN_183446 [Dreissena polymorpha]|uniref:Uncharacterized protein n=1 Tax=Dreissena polymorpha TaxID=45954 RepID=A0A9D4DJ01_DREPO|nr:hypothetical protein DPMN_183446 [Dreissena polymorpha]